VFGSNNHAPEQFIRRERERRERREIKIIFDRLSSARPRTNDPTMIKNVENLQTTTKQFELISPSDVHLDSLSDHPPHPPGCTWIIRSRAVSTAGA